LAKRQWPNGVEFTRIIVTTAKALQDAKSIAAQMIFGDFCFAADNLRSDIDWLVIYHDNRVSEARQLLAKLSQSAREVYVPLDLLVMSVSQAKRGAHSIGPLFLMHLAQVADSKCHTGKPLELIKPIGLTGITVYEESLLYIGDQIANLEKGLAMLDLADERSLATLLQRALEAPIHVARKVLLTLIGGEVRGKSGVLSDYSHHWGDQTHQALRQLVNCDRYYSNRLDKDFRRDYDDEKYRALLVDLLGEVPRVIDFLQLNAKLLKG
jgi:predicted nucleotidyltransferase